ncbi:Phospholipid methyltransferase [Gracilaria domingensis]|nr:Phospholipid methyltransferase [Gracilaria domingensis]
MNADPENDASNAPKTTSTVEAPSFDTEIFSKFVDSAQQKIDDFQQSVQDLDTTKLVDDTKQASLGLVDNFLAGDWLNRGELYGAIQLAFVIFLLRGGGFLDVFVNFLAGPALLIVGALISAKSVFDLGPKQLSIWPAPVPSGELRTDGLYEYVRHPMYSGVLLASAGFAVATASPSRIALTIAFAAFLMKKIDVEEQFLKDSYPGYEEYTQEVTSKLIPNVF